MAIDLAALKAKLATKAATPLPPATSPANSSTANENKTESVTKNTSGLPVPDTSTVGNTAGSSTGVLSPEVMEASLLSASVKSEGLPFNHMEFLGKMNELRTRIHTQHPQMPQLLKTIHTVLSKDPEVVTLLSEDAIGVIVRGLQIQTKTELVVATTKKATASKKVKLDAEMF